MTLTPPVIQHHSWRHLLRSIIGGDSPIRNLPAGTSQFLLAPSVAIARWIATQRPDLLAAQRLRLLVAGVEGFDSVDGGAWYGLLPLLLGRPDLSLSCTFLTQNPQALEKTPFPRGNLRTWPIYTTPLGAFLSRTNEEFDLCVAFHPGFEEHHNAWFGADNGFQQLVSRGVQVVLSAYAVEEHLVDVAFAATYGFDASGFVDNPFKVGDEGASFHDTHLVDNLWSFLPSMKPVNEKEAIRQRQALDTLSLLRGKFATIDASIGQRPQPWDALGGAVTLASSVDDDDFYIELLRGLFVRAKNGALVQLAENKFAVPLDFTLPDSAMRAFPGRTSRWIDRAMWVADVWREHVDDYVQSRLFLAPQVMMGFNANDAKDPDAISRQLPIMQEFVGDSIPEDVLKKMLQTTMGGPRHRMSAEEHRLFGLLESHDFAGVCSSLSTSPQLAAALNQEGQNILFPAIVSRRPDILEAAIAAGADINHRDREGWTPLIQAAATKGDNCIDILLGTPSLKMAETTNMGWPALLTALGKGNWAQAMSLINAGASVLQPNALGVTPVTFIDEVPVPQELRAAIRQRA